MTEAEWTTGYDLERMLHCICQRQQAWWQRWLATVQRRKLQPCPRKLRLFAIGCVRRFPGIATDQISNDAIAFCEGFADGIASGAELTAARERLPVPPGYWEPVRAVVRCLFSAEGERGILVVAALANLYVAKTQVGSSSPIGNGFSITADGDVDPGYAVRLALARIAEAREQAHLLRDIFGSPFRSTSFAPAWRTNSVIALAQTIYDKHVTYLMPELARALQEAGCNDSVILEHCRCGAPHVRGCWVVDLVLGKS